MRPHTRRWALLVLVVALSAAWVGVPVWLLQPFAPQTPLTVEWSWQLRRAAPIATALFAFASLALAARLWRATAPAGATGTPRADDPRRAIARVALVVLVAASAGTAWFARQNHFESTA